MKKILIFAIVLCLFSFLNKGMEASNAYKKIENPKKYINGSTIKGKTLYKKIKNYQCKKCRTALQSDKKPNSLNCPSGNFHQWTDLGEVGPINYQCKKCRLLIKSKSLPSSLNCPSGNFHQWTKL